MTTQRPITDPRARLPGFLHKRPQVARYKRAYRIVNGVAERMTYSAYYRHFARNLPLDMLRVRKSVWVQTLHRLYPYGMLVQGNRSALLQKCADMDAIFSDLTTIYLKRKPNKRCVKELKWIYDIVMVHPTNEHGQRWKITLQTLPLTL